MLKYLKMLGISMLSLVISVFLVSVFSYFNLLNGGFLSIVKLLIPFLILFITSIKLGQTSNQKGFVAGIINGLIMVVVMILFKLLIFDSSFSLQTWLYYFLLLIISMAGGMIGINKKEVNN